MIAAETTTSCGTLPWKSRPAAQVRLGRSAEAALSQAAGQPVSIEAFEVGSVVASHRALKITGLILLAPLWIPLLLVMIVLLILPSWIYIPYRTWREWDDAKSLGVSSGTMILNIVLVFGFGFVGGVIMTLILIGKLVPLGNTIVVARICDRVALLSMHMPMLNYPQFRTIEFLPADDLRLHPSTGPKRVVLVINGTEPPKTIVVRRMAAWLTGSPEINNANLDILVGSGHGAEAPRR